MKKILILIIALLAGIVIQAQSVGGRYYTIDGSTCTITITDTGIKLSVTGMGNTYYVACGQDGNTLSFCNYNSGVLIAYVLLDGRLGVWTIVGNSTIVFAKEGSGISQNELMQLQQQYNSSQNTNIYDNSQGSRPCAAIRAEIKQWERRMRDAEKTKREAEERIDNGSGYVTNTSIINSCIEIIYNCEAQINELTQQLYNCSGY